MSAFYVRAGFSDGTCEPVVCVTDRGGKPHVEHRLTPEEARGFADALYAQAHRAEAKAASAAVLADDAVYIAMKQLRKDDV